jgi:hypothetical protein
MTDHAHARPCFRASARLWSGGHVQLLLRSVLQPEKGLLANNGCPTRGRIAHLLVIRAAM